MPPRRCQETLALFTDIWGLPVFHRSSETSKFRSFVGGGEAERGRRFVPSRARKQFILLTGRKAADASSSA